MSALVMLAAGVAAACTPEPAARVAAMLDAAAQRFALPPAWMRRIAAIESRGDSCAVSPKGAIGVMQVMPKTYAELRVRHGLGADPFHVGDNIVAGASYLATLCARYGAPGCFAAYNAGPGRYERHLSGAAALPSETRAYLNALAPLTRAGRAQGVSIAAAPPPSLFVRGPSVGGLEDASSGAPAAPVSGLFVPLRREGER